MKIPSWANPAAAVVLAPTVFAMRLGSSTLWPFVYLLIGTEAEHDRLLKGLGGQA